ncbi:hypothetical protein GO988_00935 [Hymenobacter sp. HMF4947]|uniref:Uncharacterized protein n=1 Tax=Hymenobacter ginkgonis TaxID=2682976 RepID=A0A7K1T914_9BACT|nr:hypothetical protein [Hymenobacter ginkgonis]MVN74883.1 hypothetical protein [Hymenobacter ginkgonis]
MRPQARWVAAEVAADTRKRLTDSLIQAVGRGKYTYTNYYVAASQEYYVALVLKSRQCSEGRERKVVPHYTFYGGPTRESIDTQVATDMKLYPENVGFSIVNVIDCRAVLGKQAASRPATGRAMSCEDLVYYRDVELLSLWNKQRDKYAIQQNHVADVKRLKSDLLKESNWSTSNWQVGLLAVKTLANTTEDFLGIATPQGALRRMAKKPVSFLVANKESIELYVKGGKTALSGATTDDIVMTVAAEALSDLNQLTKSAALLQNLAGNIASFQEYYGSREVIETQVTLLDKAIASYNAKLQSNSAGFARINNYKNYVDAYLAKSCGKKQ